MTSPQRKTPVPDTVSPPPHSDQQWQLQSEPGSLLMSNKLTCSFIALLRVEKQINGKPLLQSLSSLRYSAKHFTTVWDWFKVLYFQNWHAGILLVFLSLFIFWLRKPIYWVFSVVMILHTCWGHCGCLHTVTEQCSLNLNNTNNANIIIWHILKLILVVHASYQFKNLIFFQHQFNWCGFQSRCKDF